MWCGILGPIIVRRADGATGTVAGSTRRLIFASLLSRVGQTVSPDLLMEDVWGAVPPPSALKTLRSHIVRLRDDLGREEPSPVLVTDRTGYRLVLGPDELDAAQFERGMGAAAQCVVANERERALRVLDGALGLWRGDAFEEFADAPFAVPERVRLFELRALAEEQRTDVALSLGMAAELIAGLEKRVAAAPYRERSWEQLAVALYLSGRQADALGVFRRARERLAEDLGVDPGPGLQHLERRILQQDASLRGGSEPGTDVVLVPGGPGPDVCPYRGLASYADTDASLFVGRERLTANLVGRLAEHRVVVVAGASGTGKSSLLRAGLVDALRRGALPGSAAWRAAVTVPTDAFIGALIGELDVLLLDQAEELFTQCGPADRAATVALIEQFVDSGGRVVIALRGDYYGRLAEVQPLGAFAQEATVLVGPLREDELRRVVIEPATRIGLTVEPELVEAVLDDVAGQPAALPMLSAALVRTWQNRDGSRLTLDGYRHGGGVASAVEATAEEAYARFDDDQRRTARRLIVRLAGREGDGWVRRPLRLADAAPDEADAAVLGELADSRLVTVAPERVELTHDALLTQWPRLRGWLEERVLAADLLDHLALVSRAWQDAGRSEADLYRGTRLQAALDWRDEHGEDISDLEAEYLAASAANADAELVAARARAEREAHGRRRLRVVAIGLAVMVVLAGVVSAVAARERSSADTSAAHARAAALSADARRLAALSVTAPDIATSSLLAVAGYRLDDSADTRGALLSAVERSQTALWRIQTPARLLGLSATEDGTRLAAIDNTQTVHIFDPRTRRQITQFPAQAGWIVGMTGDGKDVLAYGAAPWEFQPIGRLSVLSVATGKRVRVLTTTGDPHCNAAVSPDGRWISVLTTRHIAGGIAVDVYDTRDLRARPRTFAASGRPVAIAVSNTAVAVQQAAGQVEVRSVSTLRLLHVLSAPWAPPGVGALGVSPDGSRVAVVDGADQRRISVLDSAEAAAATSLPTQPLDVTSLAFAPDGVRLAVTSQSGSVAVYSAQDGSLVEALAGQSGQVGDAVWTGARAPTGLYTAGLDSQLVSWSISSASRLVSYSGPDIPAIDRGWQTGRFVIGLTPMQQPPYRPVMESAYVADLATGRWSSWRLGLTNDSYVNQAVVSADGTRALLSIQDSAGHNRIDIWDATRRVRIGELKLPAFALSEYVLGFIAAISPDGNTAYCSLGPNVVGVFALPSGRYLRKFTVTFAPPDGTRVTAAPWAVDPHGRLLVYGYDTGPHPFDGPFDLGPIDTVPNNHRLALVDTASGRVLDQVGIGAVQQLSGVAWSPDGHWLAAGTLNGQLMLFDAASLTLHVDAGAVEPGFVLTVGFSPDDRSLVVGGSSGAVSFFNAPDLTREGDRLPLGDGHVNGGTFAWYDPSGQVVGFATDPAHPATDRERWFTLPARPNQLASSACALAAADMTREQWQRYVGARPYQHVCPPPR